MLYVTTPNAYLALESDNVVVKVEKEVKFRVPIHNLESIVSYSYFGISPALMALCAERQVALSFMTVGGRFRARVTGPTSGNVQLRRTQYRAADCMDESLMLARMFVIGKVTNCRVVLMRALRDHEGISGSEAIKASINSLTNSIHHATVCNSLDALRGIEGTAASIYFGSLDHLILVDKDNFYMKERNRRPPTDNFNSMLSFLYTLLAHDVQAALETVGLDPQVGFLHRDRPGRPGLALDIMEELRPWLVDRLVLSLINRRQISADQFEQVESGGIKMNKEARQTVIAAWQSRKQEEIIHPEIDEYPPLLWK